MKTILPGDVSLALSIVVHPPAIENHKPFVVPATSVEKSSTIVSTVPSLLESPVIIDVAVGFAAYAMFPIGATIDAIIASASVPEVNFRNLVEKDFSILKW